MALAVGVSASVDGVRVSGLATRPAKEARPMAKVTNKLRLSVAPATVGANGSQSQEAVAQRSRLLAEEKETGADGHGVDMVALVDDRLPIRKKTDAR